jgi:hypothetical protein
MAAVLLGAGFQARADTAELGRVTVYGPDEMLEYVSKHGGDPYLAFPGARRWVLEGDPADYYPMSLEEVVSALEAIEFPIERIAAHVLVLPVPRRDLPKSSAEGNIVFLCPGRVQYPPEHIHYTVTHEMGHVIQHALMPDSRHDLWDEYVRLRGLDQVSGVGQSAHASSLHEIFAEDFRILFGGERARCGGEVENHNIGSPLEVDGLEAFMFSLLEEGARNPILRAYPNPFEVNMVFSAGSIDESASIDEVVIYDATGRLIRTIRPSGRVTSEVVWDGRTDNGGTAAPGLYLVKAKTAWAVCVCKVTKISR